MDGIMSSKLFATRQGTIFLGLIAAVIAAVALIVYLHEYRSSVANNATSPVLIATHVIEPGTSGDLIGRLGYEEVSHKYAKSDIDPHALVDPSALSGLVAVKRILTGSQLTADDFGPATGAVIEQLDKNERAVVIPLGTPQQVGGQIGGGSHVDIWVTVSSGEQQVVEQLLQDVYVLGVNGGNVTLRVTPQQAGQLIYASENAQPWFVLRPTIASKQTPKPVTGLKAGG